MIGGDGTRRAKHNSSFAMKKKDRAKVRTKAALMKSAVSFLRYAMIPPF